LVQSVLTEQLSLLGGMEKNEINDRIQRISDKAKKRKNFFLFLAMLCAVAKILTI
jgi:hypothetical protein